MGRQAPFFFNQVFSVAVSPADANVRVLGDLTGLYQTKDAGKRWDRVAAKDKAVYVVVADPSNPGSFLAAGDGFFLRSNDGGKSWRETASGLPSARIRALAVEPASRQTMYAFLSSEGLYRSSDAGVTWTKTLGLTDATMTSLAVKAGAPQTVFAMHTGRGFVRSDDGGATFRAVGGGIPASRVTDVLTFAAEPQTIFAVSTGAVYKTTNGGENWQASNTGLENTEIVAITRDPGPAILFATDVLGGFYHSNDGGRSWVQEVPR